MRLHSLFCSGLALVSAVSASVAFDEASEKMDELFGGEPEVVVTASFPEDNPFGHVTNGERNRIDLLVENRSLLNITLASVAGSFHDASTDLLIKNISAIPYELTILERTKVQIPFVFHSEFQPGDTRLRLWLNHRVEDNKYVVSAYDSVVTIVEREISMWHYEVLSTYLITAAFLGGMGYFAYSTFFPQSKKSRGRKGAASATSGSSTGVKISSPVGPVTASGPGGYEEEWIPEHHLKKTKGKSAKKGTNAASSADDLSGGEASGPDSKKKKGKKN